MVSEPLGALVEATWKDGAKAAATPFDLSVPKNTKVHFAFSRAGYLPYATDVIADAPQVVKAALQSEPRAVSAARSVTRSRSDGSSKAKQVDAKKSADDDTIPVEF